MKRIPIYISTILTSLGFSNAMAQNDSINLEARVKLQETQTVDTIKTKSGQGNLFVGVDLFNPIMSSFTDKKGGMAMISYRVYKKWHAVAEVGIEENLYDNLDWNVSAEGTYYKLGFNWFITQDYDNPANGFFTGLRFALANYNQTINQYPIRTSGNDISAVGNLPTASVSAYWVELLAGGRVKLLGNLYGDFSIRPAIYLGSKKQEGIDPLVIPGYGKDVGPINFTAFWGLTYKVF